MSLSAQQLQQPVPLVESVLAVLSLPWEGVRCGHSAHTLRATGPSLSAQMKLH